MARKRHSFLLVSSLVQFTLFALLARWARHHRQTLSEVIISRRMQKDHSPFLRSLVVTVNRVVSSSGTINMLAVPGALLLWKKRLRVEAIVTLLMCWIGELMKKVLKRIIDRPRPNPLLVHVMSARKGKSFPSGDVASTVMLWGWLLCIGWWKSKERQGRKLALLGLPAFNIAFVGPARIYLGDHWLTDVLGGYLFGGGWLSLTLYLYRLWSTRSQDA
ncbi:MAG TPA: phosphatase PAP2 family protein [Ktedonobacteraceae bacterium]|nr:phosphatase PAP2 family protein [Ktedonobacteraceae bacterium]